MMHASDALTDRQTASRTAPPRWIGRTLAGIGVAHALFALAQYHRMFRDLLGDGIWNAVDGFPGRPEAFWFLASGILVLGTGLLVDQLEAMGRAPSWPFSAVLLLLTLTILVAMPVSGAWALLVPAIASARRSAAARRSIVAMG